MKVPVAFITSLLTNIKLEAFLYVGVAAASRLVMLFQHQDSLPCFGQRGSGRQPANTATDDNDIQIPRHLVKTETWTETYGTGVNMVKFIFLVQIDLIKGHCKRYGHQLLKQRHQNGLHNWVT